ncbi:hypothetical protein HUU05_27520 [candidate division KSB1 bacterium]|nr:hypothetical protein [candidate division KSB1 bacterium]
MNCTTFRRYLNEAERAPADAALPAPLQEHLAVCAACQLEWRVHQNALQALETESAAMPAPLFTAAIMAKLPALVPAQKQKNYETVLLFVLIFAGLVATWFSSESLRQSVLALATEGAWATALRALVEQVLSATLWQWQEAIMNTLGEQILKQGSQVLLITLVTVLVAKGAVALDDRLRKMLRRL